MAEDRMDRFERNLDRYAEESNQRMTHLERILANFSREVARNAAGASERLDQIEKLVARNAQLIERNGQQIQPTPTPQAPANDWTKSKSSSPATPN